MNSQEHFIELTALSPQNAVTSGQDLSLIDNPATGETPSRDEFQGAYGFSILMETSKKNSRGSWEYSLKLNKLFIKMGCIVPIQFRVTPGTDTQGMKIRALLVYDNTDYYADPVRRCPVHSVPTHKANHEYQHLEHVLSCRHRLSVYEQDKISERYSVVVPFEKPQPGSPGVQLLYGLMCKTSCEGGMNRQSTSIIFTLEQNLQVLGRQVMKVRVCSCPGRDLKGELNQTSEVIEGEVICSKSKKRKINDKSKSLKVAVKQEDHFTPNGCMQIANPQNYDLRGEDTICYLRVRNKGHAKILAKRALQLYKQRMETHIAYYEKIINDLSTNTH